MVFVWLMPRKLKARPDDPILTAVSIFRQAIGGELKAVDPAQHLR
jgi:hypothetical protein